MEKLDTHPCTPLQRKNGWDEAFEWTNQDWPAAWEIHPTSDVFAIGARTAEVCPVYWDNGTTRGMDWWVMRQTNAASASVLILDAPVWERVETPEQVFKLCEHWHWEDDCKEHAEAQLKSMQEAVAQWTSLPSSGHPHVLVPSSSLWDQWGMEYYAPAALFDSESALYHAMSRTNPVDRPRPRGW